MGRVKVKINLKKNTNRNVQDKTAQWIRKRKNMNNEIGKTKWAIAEGYIPSRSTGPEPQFTSHETACILNAGNKDAQIEIMIYFSDRDPVGPYRITVSACRTKHIRFNDLKNPSVIPKDTDYSCVFTSDVPIVVQHTRLDSRQEANALITTIAYAE
jgi:hypothetical protein